jgi:hypothetical protein
MKYLILFCFVFLVSCAHTKNDFKNTEQEKKMYKSWVLSRCLSTISITEVERQDALNSASAYLELSSFPVEAFTSATPLIAEFVARNYNGSIPGSFNTMKCIDLFYSDDLNKLFNENYKKLK